MKLMPKHIKRREEKNMSITCHLQQPPANNTSMHEKLQSDPFNVPFLGLRMKSPAHIKDFFDRIDTGLAIGTEFSGKLRDECSTSSRSP